MTNWGGGSPLSGRTDITEHIHVSLEYCNFQAQLPSEELTRGPRPSVEEVVSPAACGPRDTTGEVYTDDLDSDDNEDRV